MEHLERVVVSGQPSIGYFSQTFLLLIFIFFASQSNRIYNSDLSNIIPTRNIQQMQLDWHNLGEVLYRKWHVYDMGWQSESLQIENFHVCGAQFGGPIAFISNIKKTGEEAKTKLKIFTSSGVRIAEVDWDASKRVVGMGWSDLEQLVVVLDDGTNSS